LVIFVISIYLVAQDKGVKKFLVSISPQQHRTYVASLADRIQSKLGSWLRGQMLLMAIVAVLSFIGLSLLNVKFALTLALIAGLMEIVPYIGPILGGVPAVIIAFTQSPILALFVLIFYVIIQKAEGYLIVPLVMKRSVGLNPLVVMISIIIGGQLGGIPGVVVAVPLVAAASVFFGDMFLQKEE
jgi:predicted PurR-regulated permease PerM